MLKLYNALTKTVTEFVPLRPGAVKMYSCGPTVYSYAQIGNMRAYIFMDNLRRVLKFNGYKITGVMNITDVGHLVSDDDFGEDKMEKAAKKEKKSPYDIAKHYTEAFMRDLKALDIDVPEHITKATEYVGQMIEFIKILEQKGYTYKLDDGVYFDVLKYGKYGVLSPKDFDKAGMARIEENANKHHNFDFALWKFVEPDHIMKWNSPWGVGCPGWHIECSAMSKDILGDKFDIHTGGVDHLTVHHEDEIAQNDAAAGHQVVGRWMHNEFLLTDGGKASKSLGNSYTISQLEDKGYSAMDFKYFCENTHYRKQINFTFEALNSARVARLNLKKILLEHKNGNEKTAESILKDYDKQFLDAINDDLNIPLALGVLWTMLKLPRSKQIHQKVIEFDRVFALNLSKEEAQKTEEIPEQIIKLAQERQIARAQKNWAESDRLRDEIAAQGFSVKDTKEGFEIIKN
ncbi:MAG: cysteine--tRNA ligase [Christensenellaceae bacterium]|jgi:cysteinyl-tRNA synthetase|nr:cysteine--tRNA ligase [Christensenellaceae bacterium]